MYRKFHVYVSNHIVYLEFEFELVPTVKNYSFRVQIIQH